MLRVQTERSAIVDTRNALEEAKEALYAYAEVSVGLPCPDTTGDGISDACSSANRRGQLPWRTLGLTNGDDGWHQSLRYLVSPNLVVGTLNNLAQDGDISVMSDTALPVPTARAFAVWSIGPDGVDASAAYSVGDNRVAIGSTATPADDIVTWGSRFTLTGRMLQAGQPLLLN